MAIGTHICWPRKVVTGAGSIGSLGQIIKEMGKERVMLVTDKGLKGLPLFSNLATKLTSEGLFVRLFAEIDPNPVEATVHALVADMNEFKPEVLVCIGGGSPIDVGKAANVVYTHGGIVNDYDIAIGGIMKITPKLLPLIAVPTTAGTGTEVTFVGVITDTKNKTKFGVLSPLVIPDVALMDPELTVSKPPNLTAFTGIDALTHCIEAYTSIAGFPPACALALYGIRMISGALKRAVKNGRDIKAREDMLMASMMAGTAFSLNGLGACHAMAHQLSAFFDTPHGLANAILLPLVMKFNLSACPGKFAEIAQAMGADISGLTEEQAAQKALEMVRDLADAVGVPRYLDDVGARKDRIPELVERAMKDNPITTNPRPCTPEDITMLYREAFKS